MVYTLKNSGQPLDPSSNRGNLRLFVEGVNVEAMRPGNWNRGTRTVVRVLPVPDPRDNTIWAPFRLADEPGAYGDWIRLQTMATFGTSGKETTIILYDRNVYGNQMPDNLPYKILRDTAIPAILNNRIPRGCEFSWQPLIPNRSEGPTESRQGEYNRSGLEAPRDIYMVQAIIAEYDGRVDVLSSGTRLPHGSKMEDPTVVLLISVKAGISFLSLLDSQDSRMRWTTPSIIDPGAGKFVYFQRTKRSFGGGQYDVGLLNTHNGFSPSIRSIFDVVRRSVLPWDTILHIPNEQEQIKIMSEVLPASLIVKTLEEQYGGLIPQDVMAKGREELGYGGVYPASATSRQPISQGVPRQSTDFRQAVPEITATADEFSPLSGAANREGPVVQPQQEASPQLGGPVSQPQQTSLPSLGSSAAPIQKEETPLGGPVAATEQTLLPLGGPVAATEQTLPPLGGPVGLSHEAQTQLEPSTALLESPPWDQSAVPITDGKAVVSPEPSEDPAAAGFDPQVSTERLLHNAMDELTKARKARQARQGK